MAAKGRSTMTLKYVGEDADQFGALRRVRVCKRHIKFQHDVQCNEAGLLKVPEKYDFVSAMQSGNYEVAFGFRVIPSESGAILRCACVMVLMESPSSCVSCRAATGLSIFGVVAWVGSCTSWRSFAFLILYYVWLFIATIHLSLF